MCMSVKKIEERLLDTSKYEELSEKLCTTVQHEKIDDYSLVMLADSYEFGYIYALKGVVEKAVCIYESLCELKERLVGRTEMVTA